MQLPVAVVMIVGVLCLTNLLLTLGVVRRLREHATRLAELPGGAGHRSARPADLTVAPGTLIGAFDVTTVDGQRVTRENLPGRTVIAFFAMFCDSCVARVPHFVEYAGALPGGREAVLAVVVGDPVEAASVVADLTPVSRVVVEALDGPLSTACAISGFPAYCLIDEERRLVASGMDTVDLPLPAQV